jgi:starch-binding outer membrane protein, SusD/RagB family
MKTRIKRYKSILLILVIAIMLMLEGCDQYLEENPDNRVELNTPQKAAQLLTNAYSSSGYLFTEWMSDNVSLTTGTFLLPEHEQAYQWDDIIGINQDTPTNFWEATYDAIAHANEVLAVIDNMPGDEVRKDAVKGEALLTRAYGHFMLVNLFAPHYSSQTAGRDLGIPYVEEPEREFIKKYTRNSVREVYNKIEDDLLDGLELINESFYANSGKYHFTKNAALAFASRFYLFQRDYTNCIKYSTQLLGADPGIFIKDIDGLLNQSASPEDFLRSYAAPADQSNLLLIRNVTNYHVNVGYWPSPNLVQGLYNSNPFGKDDTRTSDNYPIFVRGNGWALGKYEFLFERSSLTSNVGLNYTIVPALRGEEVLLNRAEAYVLRDQLNLALADLQVIVNKRYADKPTISIVQLRNYYQSSDPDDDWIVILLFILDERRKEFMHEGLRWFDIRRYGFEVEHQLQNGSIITLRQEDRRKVLQIPQTAIDVGGLEPNPR